MNIFHALAFAKSKRKKIFVIHRSSDITGAGGGVFFLKQKEKIQINKAKLNTV